MPVQANFPPILQGGYELGNRTVASCLDHLQAGDVLKMDPRGDGLHTHTAKISIAFFGTSAGDSNHRWQKQQAQKQQLRTGPEASKHRSDAHVKRVPLDPKIKFYLEEMGLGLLSAGQQLLGLPKHVLSSLPAQSGNPGYRMRKCSAEAMTLVEQ